MSPKAAILAMVKSSTFMSRDACSKARVQEAEANWLDLVSEFGIMGGGGGGCDCVGGL